MLVSLWVVCRVNGRMSQCCVVFGVYIMLSGSNKTGTCVTVCLLYVKNCFAEHLSVVMIKLRSSLASHLGHTPRFLNIVQKN